MSNQVPPTKIKVSIKASKDPDTLSLTSTSGGTSERSYLGKDINDTYGERQLREHVLNDPDTFAGSIIPQKDMVWCYSEESGLIYKDEITFIECFFKLFDELLVNMIDQNNRIEGALRANPDSKLERVTKLQVWIDEVTGRITMENNGEGIDVAMHTGKNKYVPEMIFGDLLTSTNYDKSEKRTVGGKNGLGAKIANIFSKEFTVETVDRHRKLYYKQTFRDNMTIVEPPVIEKSSKAAFTRVTYLPDYARFAIDDPSKIQDWLLLKKRVIDAAACTMDYTSVWLNGKKLKIKDFEEYISLYIGNKRETKRVFLKVNDRWEIGVCLSPKGEFEQVSFVNGICTDLGGRHVNHVADNLAKKIGDHIAASSKKKVDIKQAFIKQNLMIFLKSTIENPTFDSQTKRKMTSLVASFGSKCDLPDEFVEDVIKLGVLKRAEELAIFKTKQGLDRATDGNARAGKIYHPKLIDAKSAGPKRKVCCTMALTEGDSAANFMAKAIKGLQDAEHTKWGWFPLRGKLLNIRQATIKQLENNEEIMMIKKIFGLVEGKVYTSTKEIRYDRLMIMSDNDKDGHHIKGLVMNYFSAKWPSLLQLDGFVCDIATPINKVKKTDSRNAVLEYINFFTESQFRKWMDENNNGKGWKIKYYKGLGAFEPKEARELMEEMSVTDYVWDRTPVTEALSLGAASGDALGASSGASDITAYHFDMAFSKGNEDLRKDWINDTTPIQEFEPKPSATTQYGYVPFINNQLKEYSRANVERSVPNIMDGFKPSQRKILFSCFKRKLYDEIKVAQLAGYVSEHSCYHHGEASLNETIVGLAQDYVGACNINLLYPAGSFGSRMGGGKDLKKGDDSAATRYIYTYLSNACKKIFNDLDTPLLKFQSEEGIKIEPEFYLPVIPIILANGVQGIGTGYSSSIQCYNPVDIMDNQIAYITGKPMTEMIPWYRGYNGVIEKTGNQSYVTVGRWHRVNADQIRIEEIPVGTNFCKSYKAYVEFLGSLLSDPSKRKALETSGGKDGKPVKIKVVTAKPKKSAKKAEVEEGEDGDPAPSTSSRTGRGSSMVGLVKDYDIIRATDTDLVVDVTFEPGVLEQELANNVNYKFEKNMKLAFGFSTKNMHLFDHEGVIKKYDTPLDIISAFCDVRLTYYEQRRQYWIRNYRHKYDKACAKYRFISEYIEGKMDINRKEESEVIEMLQNADPPYPMFGKDADDDTEENHSANYNYLLNMQIRSLTKTRMVQLEKEMEALKLKFTELENTTDVALWLSDIEEVRAEWFKTYQEWVETNQLRITTPRKVIKVSAKKAEVAPMKVTMNPPTNPPTPNPPNPPKAPIKVTIVPKN